ncbi:hypothetical protein ACFYPG_01935 [Micromonospora sp. NPDC005553]
MDRFVDGQWRAVGGTVDWPAAGRSVRHSSRNMANFRMDIGNF